MRCDTSREEKFLSNPNIFVLPQIPNGVGLLGLQVRRMRQGKVEIYGPLVEVDIHDGRMFRIPEVTTVFGRSSLLRTDEEIMFIFVPPILSRESPAKRFNLR